MINSNRMMVTKGALLSVAHFLQHVSYFLHTAETLIYNSSVTQKISEVTLSSGVLFHLSFHESILFFLFIYL